MKTTIWIQPGPSSRETVKAIEGAGKLGYDVGWGNPETTLGKVPVGSVDYCEEWLGFSPRPDFYPDFLSGWMRRLHWSICGGIESRRRCFAKSAERYKSFPARIYDAGDILPDGWVRASDVVEFTQEWRYYVADGCVLATGWYDGDDEDEPAPDLNINWPAGFCGAVDFGRLSTGRIALVESHHPYACGWYGDDSAAFVMWLVEGWRFMLAEPPSIASWLNQWASRSLS